MWSEHLASRTSRRGSPTSASSRRAHRGGRRRDVREQHEAHRRVVEAEVEQRVVELAERAERPQVRARRRIPAASVGTSPFAPVAVAAEHADLRGRRGAVDRQRHVAVVAVDVARRGAPRLERRASRRAPPCPASPPRGSPARSRTAWSKRLLRDRSIDEAPLLRALAAHALGQGREHVGEVAPHLALVHEPGEPAGAREHREQRRLRERDGAAAVVGEQDLLARERELVAAARGDAVQRARGSAARSRRTPPRAQSRVSFVNLQKLTLNACVDEPSM